MEQSQPAQIGKHQPANNRSKTRRRVQHKVYERNTQASLVYKVQITHCRYDQTFIGARGEPLDDARCEQVLVADPGLAHGGTNDVEEGENQEDGSLAVPAAQRADKRADASGGEEVVP